MTQNLLSQTSTTATDDDRWVDPRLAAHARRAAARGAVLLRNAGALPLRAGEPVAVFGRVQRDWFSVGYGSGGDVNAPYSTDLLTSLRESGAVPVDEELADVYTRWCAENPVDAGDVWGQWPRFHEEMPLAPGQAAAAAERSRTAVVVIGRAAGEDRENVLEEGSFLLTALERDLLDQVTTAFERTVVVLDAGNVIDLSWVDDYRIDAVLLAWLGGMEGARAIADVLTGEVEPGGRLTDSIARRYEDYPSAGHFGDPEFAEYVEDVYVGYRYFETFAPADVLFPFGFGLGYTTFDVEVLDVEAGEAEDVLRVRVTNTGERAGSQVVQVYAETPDGALGTPDRSLVAFARTADLAPGAAVELALTVPVRALASYDDAGVTGHRSAWVLQAGTYRYLVGTDVRAAVEAGTREVEALQVVEQLEEAAAVQPEHCFDRIVPERDEDGRAAVAHQPVPVRTVDLRERILSRLPGELVGPVGDSTAAYAAGPYPQADGSVGGSNAGPGLPVDGAVVSSSAGPGQPADDPVGGSSPRPDLRAVARGELDLDAFVAALPVEDLVALTYGDTIMDSPLGAPGNAGAFGGVSAALRAEGVPAAVTTDGPSGIRLSAHAALLPCGTALASTWDVELAEELAGLHAEEMLRKGSDVLLSPGMNIHRNPLCGRNFEYFSEDPLLAGRIAGAVVRGIQSRGVAACPKHFAANNQETNRFRHDSRVSERALREIYLRGFELCVREAAPRTLMTSYNKINGIWAHYHYDLATTILRGEWGFGGTVLTDWWMQMAQDPEFPALRDSAYRVRAQVDVLMPGSEVHFGTTNDTGVIDALGREDGLTLAEVQRSARNVLRYLLAAGIVGREVHVRGEDDGAGKSPDGAGQPPA